MIGTVALGLLIAGAIFIIFGESHLGSRLCVAAIGVAIFGPVVFGLGQVLLALITIYWWLVVILLLLLAVGAGSMHAGASHASPRTSLKRRVDHDG